MQCVVMVGSHKQAKMKLVASASMVLIYRRRMMTANTVLIFGVFLSGICAGYDFHSSDILELHKNVLARTFQSKLQEGVISLRRSKRAAVNDDTALVFPKVQTTSGVATGVTTETGHEFYEIPFAKPPLGDLRWMEPQPIEQPTDINATTNDYIYCYQYPSFCSGDSCPFTLTEDCLVLNVFIPKTVGLSGNEFDIPSERMAVMFYIHGGSFKINGGTDPRLNGAAELANVTNNIVVTINYRLGALGFLSHEQSGQPSINGNQGIKDQRLAMQWVQDNIGNFGGDKDRVMIFGNSAGAQSAMIHTLSPLSKDLFSSSIQQSNPHIYSFYYPDHDLAMRISDKLVRALGCNSTSTNERQCLLDSSPEDVMSQMQLVESQTFEEERVSVFLEETFLPIIDGTDMTAQPADLYRTGQWNTDKNVIIGVNTQESENTQYNFGEEEFNATAFMLYNMDMFGEETGAVIAQKYIYDFPPPEGEDYRVTLGIEFSHYHFDCASRLMARYVSSTSELPVYFYANSHPVLQYPCVQQNNGNKTGCYLATHASEIIYVFRTVPENEDFTEEDLIIENEFSTYWGSFARSGNPSNGLENSLGDFPSWPEYTDDLQNGTSTMETKQPWTNIHITSPMSVAQSGYKENICDFWDDINYAIRAPSTSKPSAPSIVSTTSRGCKAEGTFITALAMLLTATWSHHFE